MSGHFPSTWGPARSELPDICRAQLQQCHPFTESQRPLPWLGETVGSSAVTPIAESTSGVRTHELQRLEAVLMLAREPLPSRKLAQLARLDDGTRARTLIRKLNQLYDAAGRSFRVEEVAGGYQMLTRQKFASWLRRLGHVPPEMRLSAPALETLAVIAYRQPVLKADIEAIRGVNCGEILRQLMERDLIRIGGRSEELGRPYLYQVTRRFLQIFGIRNLEELPRAEILRGAPLPPVHKSPISGQDTSSENCAFNESKQSSEKKESAVSVTITSELAYEETLTRKFGPALAPNIRAEDDDDDDFDDEDEVEDDDDLEEEEDDFEDEDEEDDDFVEEDDLEEGEEWEEVDDDEEDDEDWDDDEDDEDWDDEEEEEEEEV